MEKTKSMADAKNCTPAQLALAWVLSQGDDIVPIPGTKHRKYVMENAAAVDIELTDEELTQIKEIAPKGVAAGQRYPEESMKTVNR